MMGTDTTKDAALRLCAQVVEERDALKAMLRRLTDEVGMDYLAADPNLQEVYRDARALLARLDGRTG